MPIQLDDQGMRIVPRERFSLEPPSLFQGAPVADRPVTFYDPPDTLWEHVLAFAEPMAVRILFLLAVVALALFALRRTILLGLLRWLKRMNGRRR